MIWLALGLGVAAALMWLQFSLERETVGDLEVLNPGGAAGVALVVYHPGLSDLQAQLTAAFARGLTDAGWRVERTTTSPSAPTDLSGYDLLVLGVHTYWWAPDGPTRRYLGRLELGGTSTVALLSALGAAGRAQRRTEALIRAAGGEVVTVLPLFTLRPNLETDPRPNREVALELAYRAGREAAGVR